MTLTVPHGFVAAFDPFGTPDTAYCHWAGYSGFFNASNPLGTLTRIYRAKAGDTAWTLVYVSTSDWTVQCQIPGTTNDGTCWGFFATYYNPSTGEESAINDNGVQGLGSKAFQIGPTLPGWVLVESAMYGAPAYNVGLPPHMTQPPSGGTDSLYCSSLSVTINKPTTTVHTFTPTQYDMIMYLDLFDNHVGGFGEDPPDTFGYPTGTELNLNRQIIFDSPRVTGPTSFSGTVDISGYSRYDFRAWIATPSGAAQAGMTGPPAFTFTLSYRSLATSPGCTLPSTSARVSPARAWSFVIG